MFTSVYDHQQPVGLLNDFNHTNELQGLVFNFI